MAWWLFFQIRPIFSEYIQRGDHRTFRVFHNSADFDCGFLESFIILIPKNQGLTSINDFLPNLLLEWVHKLIARVLIARLHTVMDSLVSYTQTTFIRDRSIHDGWISASEVVDLMKKNRYGIIFKLDFEKTYDRLIETSFGSFCVLWDLEIFGLSIVWCVPKF